MRRHHLYPLLFVILSLSASCSAPKNIAYLQDSSGFKEQKIEKDDNIRICTDDLLSIVVTSRDSALSAPFNIQQANEAHGYLVNPSGEIDFPIYGRLKVTGLTPDGLAVDLKQRLIRDGYIRDAGASVRLLNFKVSVMGEVTKPGVFPVATSRITLSSAGIATSGRPP